MGLLCWEQFLLSCSLDGTVKVHVISFPSTATCLHGRRCMDMGLMCRLHQVWAANSAGSLEVTYTHPEDGDGQVDVRDVRCQFSSIHLQPPIQFPSGNLFAVSLTGCCSVDM